ncbi:MAG: RnfABCDGE type electron transport complex subunit D [Candidatus Aminicenantales bacterium]
MTNHNFIIKSSPHFRDRDSVPKIMYTVIIGLAPAGLASVYFFRFRALALLLSCGAACLATEALFFLVRKKSMHSLLDGSAIITGLLLAMTLPPSLPVSMAVIGSVAAIGIGKQVFGGLGHNIFNPALVGRAFLATAFPAAMTTWIPPVMVTVNTATYATPLGDLKFQSALAKGTLVPLKSLFWGNVGGCLGETSAIALLLGGLFLLFRRTIDWRIPLGILLSLTVFTGVFWLASPDKYVSPGFHLLAGGLLLGAFFMATDMVTSPLAPMATWIYALGIGFLIGLIRLFGGFPEGVMYSILLMNACVPLLNIYIRPRILGQVRKKK